MRLGGLLFNVPPMCSNHAMGLEDKVAAARTQLDQDERAREARAREIATLWQTMSGRLFGRMNFYEKPLICFSKGHRCDGARRRGFSVWATKRWN